MPKNLLMIVCREYALLALTVLLFTVDTAAQGGANREPAIVLGPSVQISADNPTAPHAESFLALNPKNPAQLVASSIVFGPGEHTAVYVSRDGGRSWQRATISSAVVPQMSGSDPIVYYDHSGAALFSGLCTTPDCSLRVWRSSDGGLHWDSSADVPGTGYDRQYLAVDMTSGPYRGRIYAAGTNSVRQSNGGGYPVLAITSSTDGGRTFLPPVILDVTSDGKSHGFGGIADMLITSRGTLVVPIQSSPDLIPSPKRQFWSLISEDGGRTFSAPRPGLPIEAGPAGFRRLMNDGNIRAAIDDSNGPFKDRIYVTWSEFENDRYVVKVTHSDDLGISWSAAVTVNDAPGETDSSNAAITVNRDGIVSLIWNDRRDDPKGECYRLYVSASLDGGDSFLPNVQVNSHPTCPNTRGNWSGPIAYSQGSNRIALSGAPARFPNGGETQGLVAGPDGRYHVAWINGESGVMQLWYTSFTVQPGTQTVGARKVDRVDGTNQQSMVSIGPVDKTDRTKEVSVEVSAPLVDFDSKSLGFTVSLKNRTSMEIYGPLTIVLDEIESDFGGITVANADNGLKGKGAEWRFLVGQLTPGALSNSRIIQWHFDGQLPKHMNRPRAFRATFRVFTERHK
jgi:hypothetical protein